MVLQVPSVPKVSDPSAASAFLLAAARWISCRPVNPFRRLLPAVGLLTLAVLASSQLLFSRFAPGEGVLEPAVRMERIMSALSPAAERYREEIELFLLTRNESAEEEKEKDEEQKLIEELGSRIRELEADRQVSSYAEAVRPRVPLVRDFAVRLAGSIPGSYYAAAGSQLPGETGIRQVLAIHRYLAGSWKYVNDPIAGRSDYLSPADRTIALGLSGDCDDFAILMASCVEAIGGRARILHGTCPDGAHAWCEAELGSRSSLELAARILQRAGPYPADFWLSLDWEAGTRSCGNTPVIFYQTGGEI
jgi:hypothetical protein